MKQLFRVRELRAKKNKRSIDLLVLLVVVVLVVVALVVVVVGGAAANVILRAYNIEQIRRRLEGKRGTSTYSPISIRPQI